MKFSFIIPVAVKDAIFLKRCILSIQEQDYKDFEIIVVTNKNTIAQEICKELKVKYVNYIDSDTAPARRNAGFDLSTGEIVWFFDADCVLLSGMLRLVKDIFEDNPDYSFVYSAYRFNTEDLRVFPSRTYDPYLLETMNYICTMSPMRRDIFPRFREDLEYFQDWDLFLRISKVGHKGYFLKDVTFLTEESDEKSISGKQEIPFWDKVKHIRNINGIQPKPICITTLGAPYQAIQRAKLLGADYIGAHQGSGLIQIPSMFSHDYKMLYVMGFYPLTIQDHAQIFANCPKDCFKVIQWIGTDVWQLRTQFNWEQIKYIRDKILKHIDIQLCNSEHLENELAEVGIKAHRVFMPLLEDFQPLPYPDKFTVGIYYSDTNPMHNEEFLLDVAKAMPDIEFKFFGGSKEAHEENIEYMRWTDIQDVVGKCSINCRITVHDGFPHTPIHFLLGGRRVITNFDMPFTNHIPLVITQGDYGKCKLRLIERIRKVKKEFKEEPDKKAIGYYREIMNPERYKATIYKILEKGKDYKFKEV
jgi:hypothetical protein